MKKDLGDLLVEKGIIPSDDLQRALEQLDREDLKTKRKLPQILVEQFRADRDRVYQEVAEYYAFKKIDVAMDEVVLNFIRKEIAALPTFIRDMITENHVLPYGIDPIRPGRLLVITTDPTKPEVSRIARAFPYQKYEICYVPMSQYEELWKKVSIDRGVYKDKESLLRSESFVDDQEEDADQYEQALEEEITRSGLVDLVESIFVDAVRVGASDIHVIPRGEKVTEFHFRIDGKLTRWYTHNETRAEAVSAVVKDRAKNLDRFERNMAQDGFAQLSIDKKTIRFRVSVIPLVGKELKSKFESIVIRVLKEPISGVQLDDLGFDPYSESTMRKAIAKPYGIIIVTGPTGSGKSTTLVACLKAVMDPSLNILTVEDPVEYFIDGARQVKLNPKLDFEGALRSILRHDPDIVMVGEVRDRLTAEIAFKLANTGHLTMSTLHTNDAPSAVSRLFKMGIEPFLIAYSINLVMAQRLVRRLCDRCKAPVAEPDIPMLKKFGMTEEEIRSTTIYHPVGCIECIRGFRGRLAIHEALYFTGGIRKIILEAGASVNEDELRQAALKNGMRTLRMNAVELMKRGLTTAEEVAGVTVDDD
jgi:type IV pilus assembly protein PilB